MNEWTIYWITRLDAIYGIGVVMIIFTAALGICGLCLAPIVKDILDNHDDRNRPLVINIIKYIVVSMIIGILISCFVPTTKEAIAIWAVPKVLNNQQVQQLPDNALKLVNEQLKAWMDGIAKEQAGKK